MKKSENLNLTKILFRIKGIEGFKTDGQVGKILGLSPSALSERKKTGSIPLKEICEWALKEGHSIDWLLTGETPERKELAEEEGAVPGLSPLERVYMDRLLEIFRTKDQGTVSAITQNIDTFLRVPAEKHPPFTQGEGEEKEKKKA